MRAPFCQVEREGPILIVTMSRPRTMNAITSPDSYEMEAIFNDFEADPELRVAILTGAGDKSFSSGHDLLDNTEEPMPPSGFGGLTEREALEKPIIAAINGYALGGGLGLALSCDIILASNNAEIGVVQGHIGGLDLSGGPHRLPRQIPYHIAMAMVLTGRRYKASEAAGWGLINEVVPQKKLMKTAKRWAHEIIACAPLSVRVHKHLVNRSIEDDAFRAWLVSSQREFVKQEFASVDLHEGIHAFAEKRKPVWTGR